MSGGWLPMPSAPKDGTVIEVRWAMPEGYQPTGRMHWDGGLQVWVTNSGRTFLGLPDAWRPLGGES